jgi:hypothetical protein
VTLEGCGRPELSGRTVLVWSALAVAFVVALGPALGVRGVAYAVAGWLVGVGLTDMVLARAVVLAPAGARSIAPLVGLALVVVAAAVAAQLARPWIDGLASALAGLAAVGGVVLGSGFFFILTRGDRALITRQLLDLTPTLQRRVSAG